MSIPVGTVKKPVARGAGRAGTPRARPRRTAAEARRAILEAAEKRLIDGGPEAIRLQDIAADVGVSHPAILHHFGSREKLIEALVQHAMQGLQEDLIAVVRSGPEVAVRSFELRVERVSRMLERTHALLAERGYARLFAWLVLSGREMRPLVRGLFTGFPQAVHATRARRRLAEGRKPPALEDTLFGAAMTMVTLFGDALFGRLARLAVGLPDDAKAGRRFRAWMANAIERA